MTQELRGRSVALIGGAGFIGHHLALELARRGAEVHVVDSLQVNNLLTFSTKMPDLHNRELYLKIIHERLDLMHRAGVTLHVLDARDYHQFGNLLFTFKPQVFIHLAAVAHAGRANKDPYSTFDHSLRTLENALDCARNYAQQFVYLSSSMVYGNFETESVDESHPLNPIGIYGALKLAGEKMVIAYQQVFNLPYTIIRPSALYGPRCVSRRVGQVFIESAMDGSVLKVEGDGQEKIDFTYVDDLVDGICLALEHPGAKNQIFNMTYGGARKIRDLVDIVLKEFPNARVETIPRDDLRPYRGTLSVKRAREAIGYQPKLPIEAGMAKYIQWYRGLQ
jgi:nucleoside-diphosphate-sugar epimerase